MRRVVEAMHALAAQQWAEQWPTVADVRSGRHAPPKWVRICRVEQNEVVEGNAQLKLTADTTILVLGNETLLSVRVDNENNAFVDLDLRPVGLAIYTDETALRIGNSHISGNTFRVTGAAIRVPFGNGE